MFTCSTTQTPASGEAVWRVDGLSAVLIVIVCSCQTRGLAARLTSSYNLNLTLAQAPFWDFFVALRPDDILTIGDLAARTGLAVSAIRFYETRGLVASTRNPGGQRRFRRSDIRRLSYIQIAQQVGFTLPEIEAQLAALPDRRTPTQEDWAAISGAFRQRLDDQIAVLSRMRQNLDGCIGCGCVSLDKCMLFNPQDRVARQGAGPRLVMAQKPE